MNIDQITLDYFMGRLSRIEERLKKGLLSKVGLDVPLVLSNRPSLELHKEILRSKGVEIIHIVPEFIESARRLETYMIKQNEVVVDQFQVDFYGVITEYEEHEKHDDDHRRTSIKFGSLGVLRSDEGGTPSAE